MNQNAGWIDAMGPQAQVIAPVAVFGVGLLTGAAAALLFAPKSGRQLRSDIARSAGQIGQTVKDHLPEVNTPRVFPTMNAVEIEAK